jgi:carbamate kinase
LFFEATIVGSEFLNKTVVVALGGNAIKTADDEGTAQEQFRNVRNACRQILELIRDGYRIVITHGNGPQAGNLLLQQEEGMNLVPPQPLDVLVAMTQGQIGYMLQQTMMDLLAKANMKIPVATVVTQVLVDQNDPDFINPSKPVGPFYTKRESEELVASKGYTIRKMRPHWKKAYRRTVPSPDPKDIVEKDVIRELVEMGKVVIAAGGGGIPVATRKNGSLIGIEGVIDKDLAAEKLAEAVGAEILLILTDVERVKLNYGKPEEKDLEVVTLKETRKYLESGQFPSGSMGPKVEACARFLEFGGEKAIIASLNKAREAIDGKTGTLFIRG